MRFWCLCEQASYSAHRAISQGRVRWQCATTALTREDDFARRCVEAIHDRPSRCVAASHHRMWNVPVFCSRNGGNPMHRSATARLVALLTFVPPHSAPHAVLPVLAFPEAGLDDSAAYQGYTTRLFRDAARNTVQIYLDGRDGRVVHVWADALNESLGFTARDSAGNPAPL